MKGNCNHVYHVYTHITVRSSLEISDFKTRCGFTCIYIGHIICTFISTDRLSSDTSSIAIYIYIYRCSISIYTQHDMSHQPMKHFIFTPKQYIAHYNQIYRVEFNITHVLCVWITKNVLKSCHRQNIYNIARTQYFRVFINWLNNKQQQHTATHHHTQQQRLSNTSHFSLLLLASNLNGLAMISGSYFWHIDYYDYVMCHCLFFPSCLLFFISGFFFRVGN